MDFSSLDPTLQQLFVRLAETATQQSAAAIATRLSAIRAKNNDQEAVQELTELVNSLVRDRDEVLAIAQGLKERLVSQQIHDDDIKHIVSTIFPILEEMLQQEKGISKTQSALDPIKAILSQDTLKVLQILGFNYHKAIGEPLTLLVHNLILSKLDTSAKIKEELELLREQTLAEVVQLMKEEDAADRVEKIRKEFNFVKEILVTPDFRNN